MKVTATLQHLRMAPRKVRLLRDLICGMKISSAQSQLLQQSKWAAKPILKLLLSAVANAEHNFGLEKNNLYIHTMTVDQGPIIKRWTPKAFGRATEVRKKTSHITLVLDEMIPGQSHKNAGVLKSDKQDDKVLAETKASEKKEQQSSADVKEKHSEAAFDRRRAVKRKENFQENKPQKKSKGFASKIFQRKKEG
ncbi:MAG: 50S ribosomal protein L22 [Parcubacteria group bacterium]|nr:50S ribosomal protein L22 [Parcubacteria group bacterium]